MLVNDAHLKGRDPIHAFEGDMVVDFRCLSPCVPDGRSARPCVRKSKIDISALRT